MDRSISIFMVFNKLDGSMTMEYQGLKVVKNEILTVIMRKCDEDINLDSMKTNEMALRCNGLVIQQAGYENWKIYSDPFCSIPLYFVELKDKILLSSSPDLLIDYSLSRLDPVGFWETVLFGCGVWMRTPFRELNQLPAASCLDIGKNITVRRYWDFCVAENNHQSCNKRNWVAELDSILSKQFSPYQDQNLVFGLSGGLDSRITALYLAGAARYRDNIFPFTYASASNSYEYRYAKETASVLGLADPMFFQLKPSQYIEALGYLPKETAGQIGNDHSHICSCLQRIGSNKSDHPLHISTYYSDAIFGWDCGEITLKKTELSSLYMTVENLQWLCEDVRTGILADIENALGGVEHANCFSNIDEFRYVAERNPRFHMALAFVQSQFMVTDIPFANYELLRFILSAPVELRKRKRILDELLYFKNPRLASLKNCSSREYFYGSNNLMPTRGIRGSAEYLAFRLFNAINTFLIAASGGSVSFSSPYQTENLQSILRGSLRKLLLDSLAEPKIAAMLGPDCQRWLARCPIVERHLSEKFQILNIGSLLQGKDGV